MSKKPQNLQQSQMSQQMMQQKMTENLMNIAKQMSEDGSPPDLDTMIEKVTGMLSGVVGTNPNMQEDIKKITKNVLKGFEQQQQRPNASTTKSRIDVGNERESGRENGRESTSAAREEKENERESTNAVNANGAVSTNVMSGVASTRGEEMYEVLNPQDHVDELNPIADDIRINLQVTLEELYNGTKKKIQITRKRIQSSRIVEEKKKLLIDIPKGTMDEQRIRYNKQGHEEFGKEAGDIVIVLKQNGHVFYEREAETLFITKKISLYESYAASTGLINLTLQTLDNRILVLDAGGIPLHTNDGLRKIEGEGMPMTANNNMSGANSASRGDLYIRFHLILPDKFDSNLVVKLRNIFPPVNTDVIYNDNSHDGMDIKGLKNIKRCSLHEVTEEDLKKLNYDEEYETGSEENDDDDE
jgi:DnaJ-class molecular chaperone